MLKRWVNPRFLWAVFYVATCNKLPIYPRVIGVDQRYRKRPQIAMNRFNETLGFNHNTMLDWDRHYRMG
jgi:hypothetical protein